MNLDNKDILLLEFLSKQSDWYEFRKDKAPIEIRSEFSFDGLDVNRDHDAIAVRLFHLKKNGGLIDIERGFTAKITEAGKYKLSLEKELAKEYTSSNTVNQIHVVTNNGVINQDSVRDLSNSPIIQSVTTTPNRNEKKQAWYASTIFKYLIWPTISGLIIAFIFYYLKIK